MNRTLTAPKSHTEQAVAPRPDLYAPIHKALRNIMCDTLLAVGRIDVADPEASARTLDQLDRLLDLCAAHVEHENRFMHPALEACQPQASARIALEHEEHLQSIAELRDEAAALRRASPATRDTLALRLYRHLALFVAGNFQHMHIEETAHNAVLWAHYDDAELMQLHEQIVTAIAPTEMLEVSRWMVPALTPAERVAVVGGMQAGAPPEAFLGLMAHIRPHLDGHAWSQLTRAIGMQPQG